jgi:tetratricopeptide (TPR) repeat protein
MKATLGLALLLAAGAHAGPPTVKVTLALTDSGRPVQPILRDISTVKPDIDADQVLSIQDLTTNIRAEQEQILTDLIASTSDSHVDEKSNYYFMLGELHAKQHRFWRMKSVELAQQADQSKNAKTRTEADKAAEKAKQYLLKTVKTYKGLTDNEAFRNYPKMDIALFYYGYTLRSGKYMNEARNVLDKLLKNYPQSKYVPEAHIVFGDHFFETGQLGDAQARYQVALKFPKSAVYWYAMYKMGWIHLKLQRYQEALETFFQVAQATKSDPSREALTRASLEDFVRAYAEVGKPDKAFAAFQRVDAARALEMLQVLGHLYLLERGRPDRAIPIYQELLRAAPADPDACMWQYNIARATAHSAATAQQVEVCTQDLGVLGEWARANGVTVTCPTCGPNKPRP